jgi:hypothetical protein
MHWPYNRLRWRGVSSHEYLTYFKPHAGHHLAHPLFRRCRFARYPDHDHRLRIRCCFHGSMERHPNTHNVRFGNKSDRHPHREQSGEWNGRKSNGGKPISRRRYICTGRFFREQPGASDHQNQSRKCARRIEQSSAGCKRIRLCSVHRNHLERRSAHDHFCQPNRSEGHCTSCRFSRQFSEHDCRAESGAGRWNFSGGNIRCE